MQTLTGTWLKMELPKAKVLKAVHRVVYCCKLVLPVRLQKYGIGFRDKPRVFSP